MSLKSKIGTGMKITAVAGAVVTYFGCSANAGSAGTYKSQLEMLQEVAEPIKQEISGIASKIDSLKSEYDFCTHERGVYLNDAGLQRCMKVTTEHAGLEKELELSQQKYDTLVLPSKTKLEQKVQYAKRDAGTFAIGNLSSLGLLGLVYFLEKVSLQFKRKEEENKEEEKQPDKMYFYL